MKLGIISDCIHYKTPDGNIATENHILLRQVQALCSYFSETLICCPFARLDSSKVISTYSNRAIQFIPLPLAGGDSLNAKLNLLAALPKWWNGYKKINSFSDIVYQRFPNNVNLPGFFYFWLRAKKVFGTYTGTWHSYKGEPITYKLQRWLLRNHFKGPVWVYTNHTSGDRKILQGYSPSYSIAEWNEETEQVEERTQTLRKNAEVTFRLITVGTLIDYKNQALIIKACKILKVGGFRFLLTIVGDGPMRQELNVMIEQNDLEQEIKLVGKKNHIELRELYRKQDFVVQAPLSEGFGKVPMEGFFHGVIPVISKTSMAAYITGNEDRGFLFDANNEQSLVDTLQRIKQNKEALPSMIEKGRTFAKSQTLEAWAAEYYKTVTEYFAKN